MNVTKLKQLPLRSAPQTQKKRDERRRKPLLRGKSAAPHLEAGTAGVHAASSSLLPIPLKRGVCGAGFLAPLARTYKTSPRKRGKTALWQRRNGKNLRS